MAAKRLLWGFVEGVEVIYYEIYQLVRSLLLSVDSQGLGRYSPPWPPGASRIGNRLLAGLDDICGHFSRAVMCPQSPIMNVCRRSLERIGRSSSSNSCHFSSPLRPCIASKIGHALCVLVIGLALTHANHPAPHFLCWHAGQNMSRPPPQANW